MESTLTFEKLPEAVSLLSEKLDAQEGLLLRVLRLIQPETAQEQPEAPITVTEAAAFLDLTVGSVYVKTSKGELPFYKRGKRVYFYKSQLTAYLQQGYHKTVAQIESSPEDFLQTQRKSRRA
ncbi:MAG TPA: DNA-binding protein [Prolixibacteraceae bacterium]|nr:DNA-binding protein [Prolixibacteraceae bacterium]